MHHLTSLPSSRDVQMTAQLDTWASHIHVRNFWGVNEGQDYDPQCDRMDNATLQSYIQSCRGDMGWKKVKLEQFRQANFGNASGIAIESRNAGWYCAQRRLGHGLGWLMDMYRNRTNIPDILMIVDDDTSVVSINLCLPFCNCVNPDFRFVMLNSVVLLSPRILQNLSLLFSSNIRTLRRIFLLLQQDAHSSTVLPLVALEHS